MGDDVFAALCTNGHFAYGKLFPERIVEKAVERMLPRGPLGRRQLGNLRVYPNAEHPHDAQQPEKLDIGAMNRKNKRTA